MKDYNVIFTLYGGLKAVIVTADNKQEAIKKASEKCGLYPVHFKECIELQ